MLVVHLNFISPMVNSETKNIATETASYVVIRWDYIACCGHVCTWPIVCSICNITRGLGHVVVFAYSDWSFPWTCILCDPTILFSRFGLVSHSLSDPEFCTHGINVFQLSDLCPVGISCCQDWKSKPTNLWSVVTGWWSISCTISNQLYMAVGSH